jgi:hypothetical protein
MGDFCHWVWSVEVSSGMVIMMAQTPAGYLIYPCEGKVYAPGIAWITNCGDAGLAVEFEGRRGFCCGVMAACLIGHEVTCF